MIYGFKEYVPRAILKNHLRMGESNPAGEKIEVNSLYFERGGRPWIGVMGEFHFSRYDCEKWYEELCKMKAGGITVVSTYLFWIYHEETEGEFDFTGNRDIRRFVLECRRAGLDVFLRIGPWAHGECRNGGFPDWLLRKPYRLRDNNAGYMEKVRIWYEHIYRQVQGLFYREGGSIIGIQFENELVNNAEHLLALKELALEIGFRAPIYTVTGWNSRAGARIPVDEVIPVFGAYVEAPWAGHTEKLPLSMHFSFDARRNDALVGTDILEADSGENGWRLPYERYPFATCELGAGLQPTHHRRVAVSGMDAYALSLVKLGSGNNMVGYYMYHGGTNGMGRLSTLQESRATGYPNDYTILNYDFHTALSQYGESREQYGLLNLLHVFVNDFGDRLAPMEYVESADSADAGSMTQGKEKDLRSLRYCMRRDGSGGFVFFNHYQRLAKMEDLEDVVIDTKDVVFPPIAVKGDISFFLPFKMDLGGNMLDYATAQPLCRVENTWFFAAVEGIVPRYCFSGMEIVVAGKGRQEPVVYNGIRLVTLPWQEAVRLRKLEGTVYIGDNCDLYLTDGEIKAIQEGDYAYDRWNGDHWERAEVRKAFCQPEAVFEQVEEPFAPPFEEELNLGCRRSRIWKKITLSSDQGFLEIPDRYDTAQIYADARLVADNFYIGEPWRVPAEMLYGKEVYLVMSELKDDVYRELF